MSEGEWAVKKAAEADSIDRAREIFRELGSALNERVIFGEGHPRFREIIHRAAGLIETYHAAWPESRGLTFLIAGDHVEFQGIPLMGLGASGDRLVGLLNAAGIGGLQVQLPAPAEALERLVADLNGRLRGARGSPPEAPPDKGSGGGPGTFRLIGDQAATDLRRRARAAGLGVGTAAGTAVTSGEPGAAGADDGFSLPEFPISEDTFRSVLESCRLMLANQEKGFDLDYSVLSRTVDQVVSLIGVEGFRGARDLAGSYFDDFNFHHSVNVCFIAAKLASGFLKDQEAVRRISMAGLLHDVGKCCVPSEILHKPGKLTPAEFECIKTHPVLGAEILLGVDGIDPLCIAAAFGHHVSGGPGSYPPMRQAFRSGFLCHLISVIDIYEALTAVRPYKKALSPEKAFQVLFQMPGLQDRLPILKMLYDCLGPYPVGILVELSTGERALVVEQNPGTPYLPRVQVLTDPARIPLSSPEDRDLSVPPAAGEPVTVRRAIVLQDPSTDPLQAEPEKEPTKILDAPLVDDQTLMSREG